LISTTSLTKALYSQSFRKLFQFTIFQDVLQVLARHHALRGEFNKLNFYPVTSKAGGLSDEALPDTALLNTIESLSPKVILTLPLRFEAALRGSESGI